MWCVDVQQQLNVVSGFWGLALNLTLWSSRRQRGLNASLQLLHTSCSPHVFHSSQTQAGKKIGAHTYTPTQTPDTGQKSAYWRLVPRKAGIFVPLYPDHNCPVWSFLRPTLIFSLTSASMKEGTATSPLACPGRMTKLATRTGTPWWACVGTCLGVSELEWQVPRTKPLHPACRLTPSPTAQVSVFPGPVSCVKGRQWPWTAGEQPHWGRRDA